MNEQVYGLSQVPLAAEAAAPELEYRPRDPRRYHPPIGLIGCGSISEYHLAAYRRAGYNVVALCDLNESRARARRTEFYPEARVYTDYQDLLRLDEIEVVDIATHPADRDRVREQRMAPERPDVLAGDALGARSGRDGGYCPG